MILYQIFVIILYLRHVTAFENISLFGEQLVGAHCTVNRDCVGMPGTSSECKDNICICMVGYVSSFFADDCLPIQNQIGAQCSENPQCQLGSPGEFSECSESVCKCSTGAVNEPNQNTCFPERFVIDDPCVVNQQCRENIGEHAVCLRGNCNCDFDNSVVKSDKRFCLPIINTIVDDICEESPQCTQGLPGTYSFCTSAKKCDCNVNATHEPNEHICYLKAVNVGDPCEVPVQCSETLGNLSVCALGICSCIPDISIPNWNAEKCLNIVNDIGGECTESQQCIEGLPGKFSSCVQEHPPTGRKICDCNTDAINEPGKHVCYPKAELVGDECVVDTQCTILLGDLSACQNLKCTCPPDISVPSHDNTRCLELISNIGGNCTENQQCSEGVPGSWSECTANGTCVCKEGAIHEPEGNQCFEETEEVGGSCAVNSQCTVNLGELSHCLIGTCSCIEGISVKSDDNLRCLPLINEIGGKCQESQQCTGALPGEFSECVPERPGGDAVCKCSWRAIKVGNVCLKKATHVDDACNITLQCTPNLGNLSICSYHGDGSLGNCICISGSVPSVDRTQCVLRGIPIGSPCKDDSECMGVPGTSQCASGICGCRPGYIASSDLFECLPIRNQIGQECKEVQQCQNGEMGRLSECIEITPYRNICNCTADAITEPGQNHLCRKKATQVGDACVAQSQCLANLGYSRCLDGHCECLGNATESTNNSRCLLKTFLDEICVDNNQCNWLTYPNSASCMVKNATYPGQGRICQCNMGYINPEGINYACYPIAQFIGRQCVDDPIQCLELEGTKCLNNTCDCDYTSQVVSKDRRKCLARLEHLNLTCAEGVQCMTENSHCIIDYIENRNACKCKKEEFVESLRSPGRCLKIINEVRLQCEEDHQCTSGLGMYSECRDGYCMCRPGYSFYDGHCYFPARLGSSCSVDGECKAGVNNLTACNQLTFRCDCIPQSFQYDNSCYLDKYVGDSCNSNIECEVSILGMVMCDAIRNKCICQFGYSPQYGNKVCSSAHARISEEMIIIICLILGFNKYFLIF